MNINILNLKIFKSILKYVPEDISVQFTVFNYHKRCVAKYYRNAC